MGFNDQEIVVFCGVYVFGCCYIDCFGYLGFWIFFFIVLINDYYKFFFEEKWQWKKWNGFKQYEDKKIQIFMMFFVDMVIIQDKKFKEWVKVYVVDNDKFFEDFFVVVKKFFEFGVFFKEGIEIWIFKFVNV